MSSETLAQPIPFSVPDIDDVDIAAVVGVLRSGWLTTGEQCAAFEHELAAYLGVDHVIAMSSCTAALEAAVAALRLPPSSRVAVPTWTFASTALVAIHQQLTPVLLDVDESTLNLSQSSLDAAIEDGLDAVIGVHFGGTPMARSLHEACSAAHVPLIEDAAHAIGADDHRGKVSGSDTIGAAFSFYATKNLSTGEGGALATGDDDIARFARSFRLHGLSSDSWSRYRTSGRPTYDLEMIGIKANFPDILAALARTQLTRFANMQSIRRERVNEYRSLLAEVDGLTFVPSDPHPGSADHLLVVLLPPQSNREDVIATLAAEGIGTSVHFTPLHRFPIIREHSDVGAAGVTNAEALADRTLSLPLHSKLTARDVERVCDALIKQFSDGS